MSFKKDISGQRFGHLIALEKAEKIGKDTHTAWSCRCDCGNEIITTKYLLTSGKKTNCGCLSKIKVNMMGEKYGRLTVIAPAENDKYNNAQWLCQCDCGNQKIVQGTAIRRGKAQSCGCLKREQNAAEMQDRRKNDLVDGTSLGKISSSNLNSNNVSGCKGVSKHAKNSKWIANITLQKNRMYLGSFTKWEDAVKARKKGEEKYFAPILEKFKDKGK
ncbi:MAG: hypothetical protein ACOH15_11435 [Acetobacterium sp.]